MENEYITKNLNLASYLCSTGLPLSRTFKIGSEFFFVFSPKNKAEELVNDYFLDKALVNPKLLFARLNDLKDLIFSKRSN